MAHAGRHNADPVLIVALASGLTQQQAAEQTGVSLRTVARRWADPLFRRTLLEVGMKAREAAELEQRIAALEERLATQKGRRTWAS